MTNKEALTILGGIILALIILFARAGVIYLVGNIMIGWSWLDFNLCISFSGVLTLIVSRIILIMMERNKRRK